MIEVQSGRVRPVPIGQGHQKDHPQEEKRCTRCGLVQPIAQFTADRYSPAGRVHSYCKSCSKRLRRERVQALISEVTQYKLEKGCAGDVCPNIAVFAPALQMGGAVAVSRVGASASSH